MDKKLNEFRPLSGRIKAIDRSRDYMRAPAEIDTAALAATAVAAYWEAREKSAEPTPAQLEAAMANRALALQLVSRTVRFGVDALATTAPVAVIVGAALAIFRFILTRRTDPDIAAVITPGWVSLTLVLAVPVAAVGVALLAARLTPARRWIWENSGGAVIGAMLLSGVLVWQGWKLVDENTRRATVTFALAEERLSALVADSLGRWRVTGEFPIQQTTVGAVSVRTIAHSGRNAVYGMSTNAIPGTLIAEIRPDRGALYWKHANKEELRARLLVGNVASTQTGQIELIEPSGVSHVLKTSATLTPPESSQQFLVVVDPTKQTAIAFYPVARR